MQKGYQSIHSVSFFRGDNAATELFDWDKVSIYAGFVMRLERGMFRELVFLFFFYETRSASTWPRNNTILLDMEGDIISVRGETPGR